MSESPMDDERVVPRARGADLIIPVLAVAFAGYFFFSVSGLAWEARANGTVIGIALVLLVAVQVVRVFADVRAGRAHLGFGELVEWSPTQAKKLGVLALLAVFVATVRYTGTSLGLFLVMFASMWILGVRSQRTLWGVSVGVAAVGYFLFIALLRAQFPEGPIEWAGTALFGIR